MAFVNFPQFQVLDQPLLRDSGYWYAKVYTPKFSSSSFIYRPLHRKAALLALFTYMYAFIGLFSLLFVGRVNNFSRENPAAAYTIWLVPTFALGIFMLTKSYNASRKIHQEANKGKRAGLYTSGESLYTTALEGTYVCQTCSTPIASTNNKQSIEKPYITVSQLIDASLVNTTDGQISCSICETVIGTPSENGYKLDGEKLALDAGELHLVYP